MKKQNVKLRKCIVCNFLKDKNELIRIVKDKEGNITIDKTGKLNGRGAYICNKNECIDKVVKNNLLNRHLKANVPNEIYMELKSM